MSSKLLAACSVGVLVSATLVGPVAAAAAVSSTDVWGPPETVATGLSPQTVLSHSGNTVMYLRNTNSNSVIMSRGYDGTSWGAESELSGETDFSEHIDMTPSGDTAVWDFSNQNQTNSTGAEGATRVSGAWNAPVVFAPSDSGNKNARSVTVDDSGTVSAYSYGNPNMGIQNALVTAKWSSSAVVSTEELDGDGNASCESADNAFISGNGTTILYRCSYDISADPTAVFAAHYADGAWTAGHPVSNDISNGYDALGVSDDGRKAFMKRGNDLYGSILSAGTWSSPTLIGTGIGNASAGNPAIVIAADGSVMWNNTNSTPSFRTKVSQFRDGGWTSAVDFGTGHRGIGISADGEAIAYTTNSGGAVTVAYYKDGNWNATTEIASGIDTPQSLAFAGNGRVVSYQDSSGVLFIARVISPHTPVALTATAHATDIKLEWVNPDYPTPSSYVVYRSTSPDSDGEALTSGGCSNLGSGLTCSDDHALVKGTTYYYRVQAKNGAHESALSDQASATFTGSSDSSIKATLEFAEAQVVADRAMPIDIGVKKDGIGISGSADVYRLIGGASSSGVRAGKQKFVCTATIDAAGRGTCNGRFPLGSVKVISYFKGHDDQATSNDDVARTTSTSLIATSPTRSRVKLRGLTMKNRMPVSIYKTHKRSSPARLVTKVRSNSIGQWAKTVRTGGLPVFYCAFTPRGRSATIKVTKHGYRIVSAARQYQARGDVRSC